MECEIKCYRVWFSRGKSILVDAESRPDAAMKAYKIEYENTGEIRTIKKIECLD